MAADYNYNGDGTWTVVFDVGVNGNDRFVYREGGGFPPPPPTYDRGDNAVSVRNERLNANPLQTRVDTGLLKWNTSSLPDDAVLQSAKLRINVNTLGNADRLGLRAQTSNWDSNVIGAWNASVDGELFEVGVGSLGGGENELPLDQRKDPNTFINKSGATQIRLGLAGVRPSGLNLVAFKSYNFDPSRSGRLVLTYRRASKTVSLPHQTVGVTTHSPETKPQPVSVDLPHQAVGVTTHAPQYVGLVAKLPHQQVAVTTYTPAISGGAVTIQPPHQAIGVTTHQLEVKPQPVVIALGDPWETQQIGVTTYVPRIERLLEPAAVTRRREGLMLSGERGTPRYEPRLFLSNIYGEEVRELPGVISAGVNLSNYRDHTWELSLECEASSAADAFNPLSDYVLVALDVSTAMDAPQRYYLGLHRFFLPEGDDEPEGSYWTLTGQSPEILLNSYVPVTGWRVAPGTNAMAAVRELLVSVGIPESKISLPATTKAIPNGLYVDPIKDGEKAMKIRVVNKLLSIAGYEAIQTGKEGQFFAVEANPLSKREPSAHYGPTELGADDMILRKGIPRRHSVDGFANEVIVKSQDPNQDPQIVGIARDEDPDSPTSIQNLGRTETQIVLASSLADQEVADRLAGAELEKSASGAMKRRIATMLDPRRGPAESYLADAINAKGEHVLSGKWSVVNWTMPLDREDPGEMTHEISRTERFAEANA